MPPEPRRFTTRYAPAKIVPGSRSSVLTRASYPRSEERRCREVDRDVQLIVSVDRERVDRHCRRARAAVRIDELRGRRVAAGLERDARRERRAVLLEGAGGRA